MLHMQWKKNGGLLEVTLAPVELNTDEAALAEKESLLKEVKLLKGLLPICSGCKRIRDENGRWWPLDAYVKARTEAELTHTICADCQDVFYSDL